MDFKIELTAEQKTEFNRSLEELKKAVPDAYKLAKDELPIMLSGGHTTERQKAFIEKMKLITGVKIPNIDELTKNM